MGVDALVITRARWLEPAGTWAEGTLLIERNRVLRLSPSDGFPSHARSFDANGLLVLPGFIDCHTHFRQPGQARKEGIRNGSMAGLKGGVTTVLDMPNNVPPCSTPLRLARKRALFARSCLTNWGLHVLAVPGREPPAHRYASGKIYMARSSLLQAVRREEEIASVLGLWPRVTFHAEDETAFRASSLPSLPHHEARPREAVVRALRTIEGAMERARGRLGRIILCHVSTADEVLWIRRQKAVGRDVWAETCPHYCLLTQDDYLRAGADLQVNPPLRNAVDRSAILEGLGDGTIDFISSDHAPHGRDEKTGASPPSGIPGIEWLFPAVLHLLDQGVLTWERLHRVSSGAAAVCFGIPGHGGTVDAGSADLVMVARNDDCHDQTIVTRAAYSPFRDLDLRWRVKATVVNGRIIYRDGVFEGSTPGNEVPQ